jgi:hypothetical protein
MKVINATNLDRKPGVPGPKTMGVSPNERISPSDQKQGFRVRKIYPCPLVLKIMSDDAPGSWGVL